MLSPDDSKDPYYAFHGWAGIEGLEENDTPNASTIWTLKSGRVLTENSPITLSWKNDKGIIFEKTISPLGLYFFCMI